MVRKLDGQTAGDAAFSFADTIAQPYSKPDITVGSKIKLATHKKRNDSLSNGKSHDLSRSNQRISQTPCLFVLSLNLKYEQFIRRNNYSLKICDKIVLYIMLVIIQRPWYDVCVTPQTTFRELA